MMNRHSTYLNGRVTVTVGCCDDDSHYFLSATQRKNLGVKPDIDKVFDDVIKNIHEGDKVPKDQQRAIVHEQYAQLREAVKEGYGKLSFQVQFGGANSTMLKNLQTNVAAFSAFKKHDMMKELVKGLRDEKGMQKDYHQFRKDALALVGNYRESWLKTEYDSAVRGCRMATVWQKIQETKRLYPNIKYIISRSAHKRQDHLALVDTILPIDHPFWATRFPPNGYECKCSAQATDEQPTEVPAHADIEPAFAINPGKDGQVFNTKEHPYAQLPQKEYQQVLKESWNALCAFERKEVIKNAIDSGMMQKKIKVDRLNEPVQLNRNSFAKNLSHDAYFFDKLNILYNIEDILQESTVMLTDNRKPKQHVKQYHVLQYISKDGKRVNLHVEERKDGSMFLYYIHVQK